MNLFYYSLKKKKACEGIKGVKGGEGDCGERGSRRRGVWGGVVGGGEMREAGKSIVPPGETPLYYIPFNTECSIRELYYLSIILSYLHISIYLSNLFLCLSTRPPFVSGHSGQTCVDLSTSI